MVGTPTNGGKYPAMATTTKTLTERFASPLAGCRVDREAGVIFDTLVCGFESANNRGYPWGNGLTHRKGTYEGKVVNCDHGRESTVDRRFGWLVNETTGADGRPRADLHVLKSHPMAERVFEAAERNPSLFGLSHVAICRTRMENGREIIEDVQDVESVDIVASPATTKGLFESKHPMPTTLKKFLEGVGKVKPAAAKWSKARWVREMDEMPPMDLPPVDDVAAMPEEDIDDGISAAFKTAMSAVLDSSVAMGGDVPDADVVKKIKKLLAAKGDLNGDGAVDAADVDMADDSDDMSEDMEKAESRGFERGKAAIYESLKTATAVGLPTDPDTLRLIEGIPADRITAVAQKLSEAKGGSKPRTSGREAAVSESKQGGGTPLDVKTIAKLFRS
jgi:hypothetical protein